jgi:putative RNA 2'-phosphotransferase
MSGDKENEKKSKFLSYILRHHPEAIDLSLDNNGWADTAELIQKANANGEDISIEALKHIVETNSKKRFAFNDDFTKIRASQGHSIEVELGYAPASPPEILFHGTALKWIPDIMEKGLMKMDRQHVHLSPDIATAVAVGQRHGKPAVLEVRAGEMARHEHIFYLSDNGVWLTSHVPPQYLELRKS